MAIGGSSGANWRNPLRVDWEDAFDQEYRMTGEAFVFCDFLRRAMSGVVPSDRTGVICDYSFGEFIGWKFRWAFQSYVNPIEIDATAMPKFDLGQAVFKDKNPNTLLLYVRCHGKRKEELGKGVWVGQGPDGKELRVDHIMGIVTSINPKALIMFIDSCFSAAAIEAVKQAADASGIRNYIILASSNIATKGKGVYFLEPEKVLPQRLQGLRRSRHDQLKVGGRLLPSLLRHICETHGRTTWKDVAAMVQEDLSDQGAVLDVMWDENTVPLPPILKTLAPGNLDRFPRCQEMEKAASQTQTAPEGPKGRPPLSPEKTEKAQESKARPAPKRGLLSVKPMPKIVKPKIGKHRRGVNRQWFGASWRPLIDFYLQLAHGHEVNRACRGLLKQYWHPRKARASKGKKRNKKRCRSRKSMRMRRSHRRRSHCRKHSLSAFVPW